jgi:hypothetical protein
MSSGKFVDGQERRKIEAYLIEASAAFPEREQAGGSEWLRAAVNHPVVTRITNRFQPAYRHAIQ